MDKFSAADRSGQSLVEILVATAIAALIVTVALGAIQLTLKSNVLNTASSQATPLGQEMSDKVRSLSEGNWFSLYNLDRTGATNYMVVNDSGLKVATGTEGVVGDEIRNNLVGYWKLDEASNSGNFAYDNTASGNKGTWSGSPLPTQAGTAACKVGGCLSFNGSSSYLDFGNQAIGPKINSAAGVTVSYWINLAGTPSANGYQVLAVKMGANSGGVDDKIDSSRKVTFGGRSTAADSFQNVTSNAVLATGAWYYVVGVYNYTNHTIAIYINGVADVNPTSVSFGAATYTHSWSSGTDQIGDFTGNSRFLNGKLDDVRIYNRVLLQAEITQLYRSTLYTRSFIVEDVYRNGSGNIAASGTLDPSTLKVTSTVKWPGQSVGQQFVQYLSRLNNAVNDSTDWKDPTSYSSISPANSIDTNTPGEIKLFQ